MSEDAIMMGFAAYSTAVTIVGLIMAVLGIIADWILFKKAGQPGWKCLIPIYNVYILFKITMGNGWLFLLLLVPIANIVILIMMLVNLSKAYGHGGGFAVGLIFLTDIFLLILAFGKSEYVGPKGIAQQ